MHLRPRPAQTRSLVLAIAWTMLASAGPAQGSTCRTAPDLFSDGFESGDTSAWTPSPTGTWVGTLDFAGTARPIALQLYERQGGRLIGYVLGGTPLRTMAGGFRNGTDIQITLDLATALGSRNVVLTLTLTGNTLNGTAAGLGPVQPVTFARRSDVLHEQRFFFFDVGSGEALHPTQIAVALDAADTLVAGGFVGQADCGLWACDGGVTSYSRVGDVLTLGLETGGGCSAGSTMTATFHTTSIEGSDLAYTGTYSFTDCSGTATGSLFGVNLGRTRSDHAACVLDTLGDLADRFEREETFTAAYPAFQAGYLDDGVDLTALLAGWADEYALWSSIDFFLGHFEALWTVDDPDIHPRFVAPHAAAFRWARGGFPSGGGPFGIYEQSADHPLVNRLGSGVPTPNGWEISGNQALALDLPFSYTYSPTDTHLQLATAGGTVHLSVGGFGANAAPVSNHVDGDGKPNFAGYLVDGDGDMVELVGNGNGIREPGEVWGFFGELDGSGIRDRRPVYEAPRDGQVVSVLYEQDPDPKYFDTPPHWRVIVDVGGGFAYTLVHIAEIATPLRDQIFAATCAAGDCIDTNTFAGPEETEILDGLPPIPVAAGQALGHPQIFADPVPGFPGFFMGGGGYPEYPWAQMEFNPIGRAGGMTVKACPYEHFSDQRRADLEALMWRDMNEGPDSMRYRERFWPRWQWAGQAGPCPRLSERPYGLQSLDTDLGGWAERPDAGPPADEVVAWAPIDKTTGVYDAALYDSPDVDAVILRHRADGSGPHSWTMPDLTVVTPLYPGAEVLADTGSEWLLKWRDIGYTDPGGNDIPVYQRAAYLVDRNGLTVEWGDFAATAAAAVAPVLAPGEPCGGAVVCYSHRRIAGF